MDDIARTLRGDPCYPRDLAALLGCTVGEAEGVLALYGYSRGTVDDRWLFAASDPALGLRGTDLAAQFVVAYMREVQWRFVDDEHAPMAELEALVAEMLKQAEKDET